MKLSRLINLKRLCFSGFLCASVNYTIDSATITQHNLDYYLRQAAENYLSLQGVSTFNIPNKLQLDYEQKLEQARKNALDELNLYGRKHLDTNDIQAIVRRAMSPFADNLKTIVYNYHLEKAITDAINAFLAHHGLIQDDIKDQDVAEFINRSSRIQTALKTIMNKDQRDYVRTSEIDKSIRDELNAFVHRIKKSRPYHQNYTSSVPAYRPSNAHQSLISTTSTIKIMLYELEQNVTTAANNTLKTYNIDPNKVPARVATILSDALQRTSRKLKDLMTYSGRSYVWRDELEQTILQEMQPVVDKILFKGEQCVICQESYNKGQRVGITSCGHHYHKDCIYQWFSYKKTCPLCNSSNIIVEKIETAQ